MRYLLPLLFIGCASAQITEPLAKQTVKNEKAIKAVRESNLPKATQDLIVDALTATQNMAIKADKQVTDLKEDVADLKPFRAAVIVGGVLVFLGVGLWFKMR